MIHKELLDTPLSDARQYAHEQFMKYTGCGLNENLPTFDYSYLFAQQRTATNGTWLRKEMPVMDGVDIEAVKTFMIRHRAEFCDSCVVGSLAMFPIQKQIYLDKSIPNTAMMGVQDTANMLMTVHAYISADNFIIDGHHRWLSAVLINGAEMLVFKARLPMKDFLALAQQYTDAIGKERNV